MSCKRPAFRPLHWFDQNEHCTVTVGYLVIAMTLYASVSGVWNTGVVVDQKIKTQAVADATAHAASARLSSALNEMAMLNMLAMRSSAALALHDAYLTTAIASIVVATVYAVVQLVIFVASVIAKIASLGVSPINWFALKQSVEAFIDLATLIKWLTTICKANRADLQEVFNNVSQRQVQLANSLTNDINVQLNGFQKFLDQSGTRRTAIYASHPDAQFYPNAGPASTSYLFTDSSYLMRLLMLATRVAFADAQWLTVQDLKSSPAPKESYKFPVLRSHKFHKGLVNKRVVRPFVQIFMYVSIAVSVLAHAGTDDWGYQLKSQTGFSEWSGTADNNEGDRRMLQVVAVAERIDSQKTFMARGFFKPLNDGDSVVAVAQAEAGNVYDEILHNMVGSIPLLNNMISFPWRMWSSMGANYQGRLTRVDPSMVREALGRNRQMKDAWERNIGGELNAAKEKDVFYH